MVLSINSTDKILVIASNPEDLAVGCGGLISKYGGQIDLFCLNSPNNDVSFYNKVVAISRIIGANKVFTKKSFENSDGIDAEEIYFQDGISNFNMNDYDIILIPNKEAVHPLQQFISNVLLKRMLETQGYKSCLQILRYEIWSPLKIANYYEDITNFTERKKELIYAYKQFNDTVFAERVLSMNKFRTFTSDLNGTASHVEAYFAEDLAVYLDKPDIINTITEQNYSNKNFEEFLQKNNAQAKIDKLSERFSGKRVVLFGAGDLTRCVFKNYDLSKLSITAIADKRFEQEREHEFYGIKCIKPQDLTSLDFDVLLISSENFVESYDILTHTILKNSDIKIEPFIQTDLGSVFNGNFENKICVRPFHTVSIVPSGHCITCCPAYIKNFVIGNLYSDNFEDIWRGKRAKYLRNALINGDYTTCDLNTCIHLELKDKNVISNYFENDSDNIKMPDTIYMGWDYDCNVACITCRNELIKNNESTLKELQKIEQGVLDACKNAKFFYTSGNGDPFGSNYARQLIKKIVVINPDIKFLIHTNGILCNKTICDELNITDKMQSVTFSIHSACKDTYDKIVRFGNFDKVIQNLEWISSLKKEGKINDITLVFVVHKLNYKDMPDFVRMAEKYDATASFRYYRQWTHNTEYSYEDMAVFEKSHPEYNQFAEMLQDEIFNSPHCSMDPSLKAIKNSK